MKNNISCLIVAIADNGIIGKQNTIPWKQRADMLRFKTLTMGKGNNALLMGKNTFLSLGGVLPKRKTIVVSQDTSLEDYADVKVCGSLVEAVTFAEQTDIEELFLAGGTAIYRDGIIFADTLYVTRIHGNVEGDTHFPDIDWSPFEKKESETFPADEKNEFSYTFEVWKRK